MNSELIEKLQKLFYIICEELGTENANNLFKKAGLRPIEIRGFLDFQILLNDDERKAYEEWITKLEGE